MGDINHDSDVGTDQGHNDHVLFFSLTLFYN